MGINWSTDHTKDKLPFSYEIVEVFDNKKVNIKIINGYKSYIMNIIIMFLVVYYIINLIII